MQTSDRFAKLWTLLEAHGWEVSQTELPSDCLWAREIWAIRSIRRPNGCSAVVCLLVDPMWDGDHNVISDERIWAVSVTDEPPGTYCPGSAVTIDLPRRIGNRFEQAVALAEELRAAAALKLDEGGRGA